MLTEADNGKTVDLRAGETLTIVLYENATTGYRWSFDGLDQSMITAREGPPAHRSDAVGTGGHATWTLTATKPGTTTVTLKLWRHWQGDASIKQRFRCTLAIRP